MKSTLIINSYNFSSDELLQDTIELIGYLNKVTEVCVVVQGRISEKQKTYLSSSINPDIQISNYSLKSFKDFYFGKRFIFMTQPRPSLLFFFAKYIPKFCFMVRIHLNEQTVNDETVVKNSFFDLSFTLDDLFLNLAVFEHIIKLKCSKQKSIYHLRNLHV